MNYRYRVSCDYFAHVFMYNYFLFQILNDGFKEKKLTLHNCYFKLKIMVLENQETMLF